MRGSAVQVFCGFVYGFFVECAGLLNMQHLPFLLANDIGLVAFAVSGVYKGINRGLDVLGASVLGFMTALGGGVTRDLLANRPPAVFIGYSDLVFAFLGVIFAFLTYALTRKDISGTTTVKVTDAIGLAAFTVLGASVGFSSHFNIAGVVLLGVVTGVGGGLISDLLTLRIPMVLSEDFYATCSIAGAFVYYFLTVLHVSVDFSMYAAFFTVLLLRISAIVFRWRLLRFR